MALRKLQKDIERTLKQISEGIQLFQELWEKCELSEGTNLREKCEADLKKEIKKLQRMREDVKKWEKNSDIKNKKPLQDARKNIEIEMERFKVFEKQAKMKAYSKEGLSAAMRQSLSDVTKDPNFKMLCWLRDTIEQLEEIIEHDTDEMEDLNDKGQPHMVTELSDHIERHNRHLDYLNSALNSLERDEIVREQVEDLKDNVEYYIGSYRDSLDDELLSFSFYDVLDESEEEVNERRKARAEDEQRAMFLLGGEVDPNYIPGDDDHMSGSESHPIPPILETIPSTSSSTAPITATTPAISSTGSLSSSKSKSSSKTDTLETLTSIPTSKKIVSSPTAGSTSTLSSTRSTTTISPVATSTMSTSTTFPTSASSSAGAEGSWKTTSKLSKSSSTKTAGSPAPTTASIAPTTTTTASTISHSSVVPLTTSTWSSMISGTEAPGLVSTTTTSIPATPWKSGLPGGSSTTSSSIASVPSTSPASESAPLILPEVHPHLSLAASLGHQRLLDASVGYFSGESFTRTPSTSSSPTSFPMASFSVDREPCWMYEPALQVSSVFAPSNRQYTTCYGGQGFPHDNFSKSGSKSSSTTAAALTATPAPGDNTCKIPGYDLWYGSLSEVFEDSFVPDLNGPHSSLDATLTTLFGNAGGSSSLPNSLSSGVSNNVSNGSNFGKSIRSNITTPTPNTSSTTTVIKNPLRPISPEEDTLFYTYFYQQGTKEQMAAVFGLRKFGWVLRADQRKFIRQRLSHSQPDSSVHRVLPTTPFVYYESFDSTRWEVAPCTYDLSLAFVEEDNVFMYWTPFTASHSTQQSITSSQNISQSQSQQSTSQHVHHSNHPHAHSHLQRSYWAN